jgi:hypothetical protein
MHIPLWTLSSCKISLQTSLALAANYQFFISKVLSSSTTPSIHHNFLLPALIFKLALSFNIILITSSLLSLYTWRDNLNFLLAIDYTILGHLNNL